MAVLKQKDINYLLLTGSTSVDVRQSLVDQFNNDEDMSLPVFLLSTKAGGVGLNLTRASVVILSVPPIHTQHATDVSS
jgi:SWI/SNF-related matrix-associated actin-dependent regulator 1 of chromatin subfamily A